MNYKFFIAVLMFFWSANGYSHSGGLNKDGCHSGSLPYHCHTPKIPIIKTPIVKTPITKNPTIKTTKTPNLVISKGTVTLLTIRTGFVYPANMKHSDSLFYGYGDKNPNFGNKCHLANDYNLSQGSSVYATDDGVVESADANINGYNSAAGEAGAIVIKHQTSSGVVFYGLYGHIKNLKVAAGDSVTVGQKIAEVGPYSFGTHLHFGINTGSNPQNFLRGYTPSTACTDYLGFVDPEVFLTSHSSKAGSCKAVDDAIGTAKNKIVTTQNVLNNDTDVDGDTLTVSAADTTSAKGVTVTNNNNGTFTYTPNIDFIGTDSFAYTVTDGKGCTKQGKVTVTVTGSGSDDGSGSGSGSGSGDGGGSDSSGGETDDDSGSGGGSLGIFGLFFLLFTRLFRKK